jgi:hypothetical protein
MSLPYRISHRIVAAVAAGCAGLAIASAAGAVDLRDWGRTFPASQRFVVLSQFNNQAVLDKETQLVWERTPDPTPRTWLYADHDRCGITPIGGRLGWRLPTSFELMTLVDPSVSSSVKLPAGHPFIGIQPNVYYWTGTRSPLPGLEDTSFAAAKIAPVTQVARAKTVLYPDSGVWCVRGQGSPAGY